MKIIHFAVITVLFTFWIQNVTAEQVSGAVFTTTANGSRVNANQYSSKCEVYLDGGPGPNAPAKSAGLPDGEYYFQVTDPSGKTLLSTDVASNRKFLVTNGVIVAYTGVGGPVHPTGYDQDHPELGAITIRVANAGCPGDYLDSPNGGGTYKVWVTPAADFAGDATSVDSDCGKGCFHGFVPAKSKTDNFHAQTGGGTFCLTLWKRLIDGEGVEAPGAGWEFCGYRPAQHSEHLFRGSRRLSSGLRVDRRRLHGPRADRWLGGCFLDGERSSADRSAGVLILLVARATRAGGDFQEHRSADQDGLTGAARRRATEPAAPG